eukprot:3865943-Amphidinium_carterae.1
MGNILPSASRSARHSRKAALSEPELPTAIGAHVLIACHCSILSDVLFQPWTELRTGPFNKSRNAGYTRSDTALNNGQRAPPGTNHHGEPHSKEETKEIRRTQTIVECRRPAGSLSRFNLMLNTSLHVPQVDQ